MRTDVNITLHTILYVYIYQIPFVMIGVSFKMLQNTKQQQQLF